MSSNNLKRSSDEILDVPNHDLYPTKRTTTEQAQQYVKTEMRGCIFSNHPHFIKTMFDKVTDEDCLSILEALKSDGLWASSPTKIEDGYWVDLPQDPVDEKSLYAPLVDILNAITELQHEHDDTPRDVKLVWKDIHNLSPGFLLKGSSTLMRPDIISQYETVDASGPGAEEPTTTQESEARRKLRAWWYRLVVIIELKKEYPFSSNTTLTQLLQYARQVFKEQPFRRFLFGCTFHRTNATFWYCDRAGVLGSCMIEIHDDPLLFIRCIASFAAMHPVDHGFDSTMLAYDKTTKETHLPWNIPPPLLETRASQRQTLPTGQWVIEMPAHTSSKSTKRESFVLFAGLSMNRAEVIEGRAGRIWLARKRVDFEDEKKKPKECPIYVFKDSWHDIRCTTEGKHYEEQGQIDGVAKLYSYEQVHILDELRRWIEVHEWEKMVKPVYEWEKMVKPVYDRDHHRLLLCSYGHPITEFISRLELVTVFKDSINGHWGLVLKKFLHRDVSRGNVVISEADSPNKGLLIDQDYTIKDFEDHLAIEGDARTGAPAFMAVEMLDGDPVFPDSDRADRGALDIKTALLESPGKTEAQSTPSNQPSGSAIPHAPRRSIQGRQLDITDPTHQRVTVVMYEVFNQDSFVELAKNKRALLMKFNLFQTKIVNNFAPYFKIFGVLVNNLHDILYTAYRSRKFDGLHERFLDVFKSFEEVLKVKKITEVKDEAAMVKRAKRRRAMHAYIVDEGLEEENEQKADEEKVEGSGNVDGTVLQPEEHDIYELAPLGEPESPVVNKRRKHN
ncbi:hypothetical protein ABKN59_009111 [Abortiporus biennis]